MLLIILAVTHERKCQSDVLGAVVTNGPHMLSRVTCHVSQSHFICQSDANCNNTSPRETSCFNPLFVNGLWAHDLSFV